jgi:predicted transcriptional regulator
MSTNTLHIAVESADEFFEDALADLRALEDGDDITDKYVLSLPDEASLERVLRAKNLELLRTIATEDPESVRELARLVDRDVKNVSEALNRLEELGLVDLEREGRAKRPVVWYDHLEIELSIGDVDPTDTGTAPA